MPKPIKPRPRLKTPAIDLLSANLLRLRTERGWTQEDLAYEAGLHRTFVGHVERKGRNPSLETVESLAAALGVQLAELFAQPTMTELSALEVSRPATNTSAVAEGGGKKAKSG